MSAAAASPSVWNLAGTAGAKFGPNSATSEATGLLTLNGDRTYVLAAEGDDVPETGVWFESRNKLLLYQQNILEQLLPLEALIEAELREETELSLVQQKVSAGLKKGALALRQSSRFNAFFPRLNLSVPLSSSANLKGTQAP